MFLTQKHRICFLVLCLTINFGAHGSHHFNRAQKRRSRLDRDRTFQTLTELSERLRRMQVKKQDRLPSYLDFRVQRQNDRQAWPLESDDGLETLFGFSNTVVNNKLDNEYDSREKRFRVSRRNSYIEKLQEPLSWETLAHDGSEAEKVFSQFKTSERRSQDDRESTSADKGAKNNGGILKQNARSFLANIAKIDKHNEWLEQEAKITDFTHELPRSVKEKLDYNKLRYNVSLDAAGKMSLSWDIEPPTEVVTFKLISKVMKTDLVAFGFSDYGDANNADLVILWTDRHGNHLLQDTHTDDNGILHVDKQQDYILDAITVHKGHLEIIFHRLYDTCDDDDYMIDAGTTHVLFFTRPGVVKDIHGLNVGDLHPGLQRVQLLKSQLPDPVLPDDADTFTMSVKNVSVPVAETTYWCQVQKLPDLPQKHHIIRFEGVISPAAEGVVHHMEVFLCEMPPGETPSSYSGPCKTMTSERPPGLEACRKVIGAWAMGAQPLSHPEEAGVPIGGPDFPRFVMVEVHYNNPQLKTGVLDSSGIRFTVTRQLRRYDAGTLEVGLEYTDKLALPPGQDRWKLAGYCTPQCTQTALPPTGIKVFASQLHTHLTGKVTYTQHFRRDVQLPDLNRDDHYSPHYQEIRRLHRHVTVLPGDTLINVCEDSTKDRENVTLGGFSISDEMCVNYMHYYPAVQLELCKSSVTTKSLYGFFDFLRQYQGEPTSPALGVSDNYQSISWTPLNVQLLQTYYSVAPLSMQCNQSDGSRFPGEWENLPVPHVSYPLPPQERPCLL